MLDECQGCFASCGQGYDLLGNASMLYCMVASWASMSPGPLSKDSAAVGFMDATAGDLRMARTSTTPLQLYRCTAMNLSKV